MAKYRAQLPQLEGGLFLTDGGIETTLVDADQRLCRPARRGLRPGQGDDGDPAQLGADYAALCRRLPWINVLGGCCGTDHRHILHLSQACREAA